MVRLIVIADDLTGALDAGVQLARQKIPATVIIDHRVNIISQINSAAHEVLIFNTESRHINPRTAASRIKRIVLPARHQGVNFFYKKTDSTMRGNIGAELGAFLESTGQKKIGFIPANPGQKRFTRNGYQYLGRKLLHKTSFANDPFEPVKNSNIPEILKKQVNTTVSVFKLKRLNTGEEELPGKGIIVFDCLSEKDLRNAGKLLSENQCLNAISGSAALINYLPGLLAIRPGKTSATLPRGPLLVINGSVNEIALNQLGYISDKGMEKIIYPDQEIFSGPLNKKNRRFTRLLKMIKKDCRNKNILISSNGPGSRQAMQNVTSRNKEKGSLNIVALQIGELVYRVIKLMKLKKVVIFGGDTLAGIMHVMKCSRIEPVSELFPGVALSVIKHRENKVFLITKPGGFGDIDVLEKIIKKAGAIQK